MFVSGHISAAFLVNRLARLPLKFMLAAAIFPDLVDKGLQVAAFSATDATWRTTCSLWGALPFVSSIWPGKVQDLPGLADT